MRVTSSEGRLVLERRPGIGIGIALGTVYVALGVWVAFRAMRAVDAILLVALVFFVLPLLVALAMPFATDAVQRVELTRTADGVHFRWLLGSTFGRLRVVEEADLDAELTVVNEQLRLGGRRLPLVAPGSELELEVQRLVDGPISTRAAGEDPSTF